MPVVFVAIDDASLSDPELAALPRALFQPVWARLIDGLLEAGARRIAFDVVFAYAGADFQVGSFTLPDYDRSLIDSLKGLEIASSLVDFPAFLRRFPSSRQQGHHGSEFWTSSLNRMEECEAPRPLSGSADGRIALGFAALGAGLSIRQVSAAQRILITPSAPITDTPTYSLADYSLACHRKKALNRFVDSSRDESWLWARRCLAKTSTAGQPVS